MERLDDLEQFAFFAEGYTDLHTFLDEVSLTQDYGAVRDKKASYDEEKIVLSTIHQSKGLEWDAVFVMNLVEGKFPNSRALEEDGGLEEERRLFYVAVTRARKHLFLSYPIMSGHDTMFINQTSPFIDEIPESAFERVRLTSSVAASTSRGQRSGGWDNSDPVIAFDDMGEEKEKKKPSVLGFLRDVDDL